MQRPPYYISGGATNFLLGFIFLDKLHLNGALSHVLLLGVSALVH